MTVSEATRAPVAGSVPRAVPWLALGLWAAGTVAAAYLAYEHFTGSTSLACPETGRINCAKVTTSAYSTFLGVPVSVLGLVFFAGLLPLLLPASWSRAEPAWRWGRLALLGGGLVFALYLVWAEFYRLDALCLWCTGVHVVTFLLFTLTLFAEAWREPAGRDV